MNLCPCKQSNSKQIWKHQFDVDYHVVKNEYDITNVLGLLGDNASTQPIKLASISMIQVEIKFLFEFPDKFIIPSLNTSQASDAELEFSSGYLAQL